MGKNTVTLTFIGDTKSLDQSFRGVAVQSGKTGGALKKMAKLAVGLAIGRKLVQGFKAGIEGASDLNESLNKTSATFRKSGDGVLEWSKKANKAFGLTRSAALEGASSIGAMLTPMGIADKNAAGMSRRMVELAADMASFNNQDPSEMLDRIRSGLAGESEPLRRFGSNLSDARVKAYAYSHGLAKVGEKLTDQQKVQARYALLLKDTKRQHGDFARTSDGLANRQRILKASFADLQTNIVGALVPAFEALVGIGITVSTWMTEHSTTTKVLVSALAGLVVAVTTINQVTKVFTATTAFLNAVMAASPVFWVIAGIVALTAAVIIAYKRSATFRAVVQAAWNGIKTAAAAAWGVIQPILSGIWSAMQRVGSAARAVWQTVRDAFQNIKRAMQQLWDKTRWLRDLAVAAFNAWLTPIRAVKTAIDNVASAADRAWSLIKKLNPANWAGAVGSAIGGVIPGHAAGGIVTQPHIGMVGEAGPEAIIPLNSNAGRRALGGGGGASIVVTVIDRTVAGMSPATRRSLARQLAPEIARYQTVG